MQIIWYNPDIAMYRAGLPSEYKIEMEASANRSAFTILYELNKTSARLAPKITKELNNARKVRPVELRLQ